MEYELYTLPDELYHHGVKGMRWGVRRYQNKDGSLTAAGRKRQAKLEAKLEKLGGSSKKSGDADESAKPAKKRASDMSDAELDRAINRARKEDEYNRLRPEETSAPKSRNHLIEDVIKPAAIDAGRNFMRNAMNKAAESLLKGKVDPNSIEALRKSAEKLELENKIAKLKENKEGDTNWDNMLKKLDYERKKKAYDKEDAAEKAKAAEEARAANEAKSREEYEKTWDSTYSNVGGERGYINPNQPRGLALYTAPTSDIPKSTVTSGKNYVDNFLNDGQELLDRNGDVLLSGGRRDED